MGAAYFATDGNYGDAGGLVIVDTSKWTEAEWDRIENADEYERGEVASRISTEADEED